MTTDTNSSDLDWLAFCYAAGEMNAAEAEAFEARLADEQSAREALSRAVELTQTVAAAEARSGDVMLATRSRADWNTRVSWMAIGGLAVVLLALLWSGVVGPTWNGADRQVALAAHGDLALAWNQTRAEFASVREAGLWPSIGGALTDDEEVIYLADLPLDDGSIDEAPSWLMAAVYARASRASESSEQRLEN
jgi:hypothetical protein